MLQESARWILVFIEYSCWKAVTNSFAVLFQTLLGYIEDRCNGKGQKGGIWRSWEKKKSTVNDELMLNLWRIKHSDYFFLGMYVLWNCTKYLVSLVNLSYSVLGLKEIIYCHWKYYTQSTKGIFTVGVILFSWSSLLALRELSVQKKFRPRHPWKSEVSVPVSFQSLEYRLKRA